MTTKKFSFKLAGEILFGRGALADLPEMVKRLGGTSVCLVSDPGLAQAGWPDKTADLLKKAGLRTIEFNDVAQEPEITKVDACAELARTEGADLFVGLGGGSAMDTAKGAAVVAARGGTIFDYLGVEAVPGPGAPTIMIPTTGGTGSEVTPFAVFKDSAATRPEQKKKAMQSGQVVADGAIIDPELAATCPPSITASSGLDALVHAFESHTSIKAGPLTDLLTMEAFSLISQSLVRAWEDGADLEAREKMALGSLYAGAGIANAGSGGVGCLSYPVEGTYGVIHGVGNALLLPHVFAYNIHQDIDRAGPIAAALGLPGLRGEEAVGAVVEFISGLIDKFGLPKTLGQLGAKEDDLPAMAADAFSRKRLIDNNMRPLTEASIIDIYRAAL